MTNNSLQVFKGGWDQLQHATHTNNITTISEITGLRHHITPDGKTLFLLMQGPSRINIYNLSIPHDPESRGPLIVSHLIPDVTVPRGIDFDNTGNIMVILGADAPSTIYQYSLLIPYDPTSIIDSPVSLDIQSITGSVVEDIEYSLHGDYTFVISDLGLFSFPLPIPFVITSFVGSETSFPLSTDFDAFTFKVQGDLIFLIDFPNKKIIEYKLSIPWDITTMVLTGNELDVSLFVNPHSISFRSNGDELSIFYENNQNFVRFHLDESWEIDTASYYSNDEDISMVSARGIQWGDDGNKFYILQAGGTDKIEEFSVTHRYNTTGAVSNGSFTLPAINGNNPSAMFLHPDGTRLFVFGTTIRKIFQYDMDKFDITTMSDSLISTNTISVTNPHGMTFGSNGNKCYITDSTADVMEYDVPIPYDLTTFVEAELQKLDVSTDSPNPGDIVMHPNDKSFFLIARFSGIITRYTMSIPGDITTGVFVDSLDTTPFIPINEALDIRRDNGKALFGIDLSDGSIVTMNMTLESNNTIINHLGDETVNHLGEPLVA